MLNKIKLHKNISMFLAGAFTALPFVCEYLYICTFLGFFFYYILLFENGKAVKPFKHTFFFAFGYYFIIYNWFTALYPFEGFSFTPVQGITLVILAWFGISALHSFITALVLSLAGKMAVRIYMPFFVCALWVFTEWFIGYGAFGFSWGRIALSQMAFLPFVQTVSLFGSLFITLVVILSAFCLAQWMLNGRNGKALPLTACALIVFNIVAGTVIFFIPQSVESELNCAIIQGNISAQTKWDYNSRNEILNTYVNLTAEAVKNNDIDFVLLPESAIPIAFSKESSLYDGLYEIAQKNNVTVILGVLNEDEDGYYNSVVAIYPNGSISEFYHKRHLVPFAEILPYNDVFDYISAVKKIIPSLKDVDIENGNFVRGTSSALIQLPDGVLCAPLVCFDSIFPSSVRESIYDGGEIITLVTNDSWYKDSAAVYQHKNHAALRAIENGRYVVRAANTGVSCVIDSKGRTLDSLGALEQGTLVVSAAAAGKKTLYTQIGDVPLYAAVAFVIFSLFFSRFKYKRHKSAENNPGDDDWEKNIKN